MNLVTGAEPPLGRNSLVARERAHAPSTRPMISGRIYCTAAALWSPRAPEVSLRKHAMQKPMFTGLPKNTSIAAIRPMTTPAAAITVFSFFICFSSFFTIHLIFGKWDRMYRFLTSNHIILRKFPPIKYSRILCIFIDFVYKSCYDENILRKDSWIL